MLIKHPALTLHLKKNLSPIYILIGQEPFLINECAQQIKATWKERHDSDVSYFHIHQPQDWQAVIEEGLSYSLFTETMILDVQMDKKTLDAAGKKALTDFAATHHGRTLILLRAPELNSKGLQTLAQINNITIVQITSLNQSNMLQWIKNALNQAGFQFGAEIPALIQQHTSGNLLASSQVIEKLKLSHEIGTKLSHSDVLAHLSDQCDYQLYELSDACLQGNLEKALHVVRLASENKTEITLVLWVLTQEVRLLIQLQQYLKQGIDLQQACQQLKIWPQKAGMYQKWLNEHSVETLHELLRMSQTLDAGYKSGEIKQVWIGVERMVMGFF